MSADDRTSPEEELHPSLDAVRWEAAVQSIMAAAAPELERRERASNPVIVLARWTRPVLSMAATVAVLASAAILSRGRAPSMQAEAAAEIQPEMAVATALLPGAMSTWVMGGETESVADLVQALEEGR